jgi:hypothetical protein
MALATVADPPCVRYGLTGAPRFAHNTNRRAWKARPRLQARPVCRRVQNGGYLSGPLVRTRPRFVLR